MDKMLKILDFIFETAIVALFIAGILWAILTLIEIPVDFIKLYKIVAISFAVLRLFG